MKSGAEDDQHVGDEMDGTWTKKLKNWDFWVTKIGGFEGSVVCDRTVRLVLGDVGFGNFEETVSEEDGEKKKFERARSQ